MQFGGGGNPCDKIYIEKGVSSGQELLATLRRAERLLQARGGQLPLRLIVVDSMAHIFRDVAGGGAAGAASGGGDVAQYAERAATMFQVRRWCDSFPVE